MARNFRGGGGFARPENALKRADELEAVGQKNAGLQCLHDVLCSKKHRQWSQTYEAIMKKHIDLCVDMKKRNMAKEALMQYRNLSHNVNVKSLEDVIFYFLKKAQDRAEEAQAKAAAATLDVQDLEEDASPEELMLSYVSGEKNKDRTDREMVTPWFRFLWESYRSMLEILRTNPKLEELYAKVANKAFDFCLTYKRTTEFKRLCDILRQHLTNLINKYRDSRDNAPDALTHHLDSRYEQLRCACELELWGEAFRSVEDIQQLLALTKKTPKSSQQAAYFTRLTQIFQQSDAPLYHAWSWLKLFSYTRMHTRGLSPADQQQMASCVLLAALAVLPYDRQPAGRGAQGDAAQQAEQERDRATRMVTILGYNLDAKKDAKGMLTRSSLLASITASNLLALVPPEVRAMYELLTQDNNPLEMSAKLGPLLARLPELGSGVMQGAGQSGALPKVSLDLAKYVPALRTAAVLRLLRQLGDCYNVMRIPELGALLPFTDFKDVESAIVDAVKFDYLQVRIDHRNGTLHFGNQTVESDRVRTHLALVAKRLAKALGMVPGAQAQTAEDTARRAAIVRAARDALDAEHDKAVARKTMIEKRKEEAERQAQEAEMQEAQRKALAARQQEQMEKQRREAEAHRREIERIEREREEREQVELRNALVNKGVKVKDGQKIDKNAAYNDLVAELKKQEEAKQHKMERVSRAMDHLERARREAEGPLLEEVWAQRQKDMRAAWEESQKLAAEVHAEAWKVDIEVKKLLSPLVVDKDAFKAQIMQRREAEFNALRRERERKMREIREAKKIKREIERRQVYVKRCQDQVEQRILDIQERKRNEEIERRKAEEAERQRKLQEAMAKQRAKEEEIERRKMEEREKLLGASAAPPAASAAASAGAVPAAGPAASAGAGPAAASAASAGAGAAAGAGAGGNRYVPAHLRRQMESSGGGGGAPPAAAAAGGDEGWRRPGPRDERPAVRDERPPLRDDRPPMRDDRPPMRDERPPAGGEDGWRRGGAPPPRDMLPRDVPPRDAPASGWRSERPAERERDMPPQRDERPPARDGPSDGGAGGGNRFVPPALRARMAAGEGPAPAGERPPSDAPPPSSAGGGSYRPPNRR